MITLSVGGTTLELPYDLYWEDEAWSPVAHAATLGLTGARIVHVGVKQQGRPITLRPPPQGRGGWMPRSLLTTLNTWRDTPEQQMTLVLRGVTYTVEWRHEDPQGAFTFEPLRHFAEPSGTDWVIPTFRFVTVS